MFYTIYLIFVLFCKLCLAICPDNIPRFQFEANIIRSGSTGGLDQWVISPKEKVKDVCEGRDGYFMHIFSFGTCHFYIGGEPTFEPRENECLVKTEQDLYNFEVLYICGDGPPALSSDGVFTNDVFLYKAIISYSGVCNKDRACKGGCTFVLIVFVPAAVYIIGTVTFNYLKGGRDWSGLCPHPNFWLMIGSTMWGGVLYTKHLILRGFTKRETSDYATI